MEAAVAVVTATVIVAVLCKVEAAVAVVTVTVAVNILCMRVIQTTSYVRQLLWQQVFAGFRWLPSWFALVSWLFLTPHLQAEGLAVGACPSP